MNRQELSENHSLVKDCIFRLKTFLLTVNRLLKNCIHPTIKFIYNKKLIDKSVIAFSKSDLWNPFDNKDNWILTAGKIENLRIAAKKLKH